MGYTSYTLLLIFTAHHNNFHENIEDCMKKSFLLTVGWAIIFSTMVYAQIPKNGLIAHYPFDGNVEDKSGNGFNGVFEGEDFLTKDRFGRSNASFAIRKDKNKIYIPHYVQLNANCNGFTISLWIKRIADEFTILSKSGSYEISYKPLLPKSDRDIDPGYTSSGFSFSIQCNNKTIDEYFVYSLSPGKWTHLVFLYNGAKGILYVDKKKLESQQTLIHNGSADSNSYLNIDSDVNIDDLYIYNRVLDDDEISSLYRDGGDWKTMPQVPQKIRLIGLSNYWVKLDWDKNTESDLRCYRVYLDSANGSNIRIDSTINDTITIGGLNDESVYQFRVTAVNTNYVESKFSDVRSVKTIKYHSPLEAIFKVIAIALIILCITLIALLVYKKKYWQRIPIVQNRGLLISILCILLAIVCAKIFNISLSTIIDYTKSSFTNNPREANLNGTYVYTNNQIGTTITYIVSNGKWFGEIKQNNVPGGEEYSKGIMSGNNLLDRFGTKIGYISSDNLYTMGFFGEIMCTKN